MVFLAVRAIQVAPVRRAFQAAKVYLKLDHPAHLVSEDPLVTQESQDQMVQTDLLVKKVHVVKTAVIVLQDNPVLVVNQVFPVMRVTKVCLVSGASKDTRVTAPEKPVRLALQASSA
jgi:hypothetical protein